MPEINRLRATEAALEKEKRFVRESEFRWFLDHVETLGGEEFMVSEKLSGVRAMRELVAAVAGPRMDTDNRESWLRRAARGAGVSYRQARALFYGEIVDPYHRTCTRFREAAGRHEAGNLAERFDSLAQALIIRDADFHQSDIAALVGAARALRGLDSARTDKQPKGLGNDDDRQCDTCTGKAT